MDQKKQSPPDDLGGERQIYQMDPILLTEKASQQRMGPTQA
jgi:hypothetical protein